MLKNRRNILTKTITIIVAAMFVSACGQAPQSTDKQTPIDHAANASSHSQHAVAMPDEFAANVANKILNDGGNAVDAAIAAQFSLAVTFPEAGNIGGGGFMLVHFNETNDFIDYRETAPAAAHRDMYLDENGDVKTLEPLFGILASGTPGTVSGMWLAHQKYGSLPWERLLAPAVNLAENGFEVPEKLASGIQDYIAYTKDKNDSLNFEQYFGHAKAGEVFKQPELALTLKRIQKDGLAGFYSGETASIIADFMQQQGGLITKQDLLNYKAKSRVPVTSQWREYTILSAAPPSSGGIAVAQWLQMYDISRNRLIKADLLEQHEVIEHNTMQYMHILSEAGKQVFADRAEYLGDPDFVSVPQTGLLQRDYIEKRANNINLTAISDTEKVAPGQPESEQTTHFSIVDKMGNAVSNTTTINLGFGSGVVVEGAGFILNDEMDDFSAKAGVPNFFGAVGGVANEIQPNKRMLSSMTPTIVLQGTQIRMVTGSPGGTTILSSVYQSILNALEFGMPAQDVVDAPRFHHQLLPKNEIRHHNGIEPKVLAELTTLGYTMKQQNFGDLHVILNREGQLEAASETRGRGKAIVNTSK